MSSFTNYFLSKFFVFDFFLWLNLICMRFALAFMSKYVPQVVCVTAHQFSVLFNFRLFLFLLCFRCARVGRRNLNVYYQCQLIFSFSFLFFFFSPHALQPHWNEKNCPLPQLTQLASQWTKYIYADRPTGFPGASYVLLFHMKINLLGNIRSEYRGTNLGILHGRFNDIDDLFSKGSQTNKLSPIDFRLILLWRQKKMFKVACFDAADWKVEVLWPI